MLPAILLALFPVILMVNTPLAFGALALAIVLLYQKRTREAHRAAQRRLRDEY